MGIVPVVVSIVWLIVFVTMLRVGVLAELESVIVAVEVRPGRSPAIVTSARPSSHKS